MVAPAASREGLLGDFNQGCKRGARAELLNSTTRGLPLHSSVMQYPAPLHLCGAFQSCSFDGSP